MPSSVPWPHAVSSGEVYPGGMRRIVVTGAAGFIGSHSCEALVAAGWHVTGVDAFDTYLYPAEVKQRTAAELRHKLPGDRFDLIEADICDDRNQVLNLHAFQSIGQELAELYKSLAARDLAAGSPVARRLFS